MSGGGVSAWGGVCLGVSAREGVSGPVHAGIHPGENDSSLLDILFSIAKIRYLVVYLKMTV